MLLEEIVELAVERSLFLLQSQGISKGRLLYIIAKCNCNRGGWVARCLGPSARKRQLGRAHAAVIHLAASGAALLCGDAATPAVRDDSQRQHARLRSREALKARRTVCVPAGLLTVARQRRFST
jgi:hypothetical protein